MTAMSKISVPESGQKASLVIGAEGRVALVECEGAVRQARVAVSCLVMPRAGDEVATQLINGALWITAILERHGDAAIHIVTQGDFSVVSMAGDVTLTACRRVRLDAGETLELAAPAMEVAAGAGRFLIDEWLQFGKRAVYHVEKIRCIAQLLEHFAETWLSRARSATRLVAESDQLHAGAIDHRADTTWQIRARTALVTGDDLVRLDAAQIHMG